MDIAGFDRYIPAREDIESVAVDYKRLNGWLEDEESETGYVLEHMEITDIEAVYPLFEAGIHTAKEGREARFDAFHCMGPGALFGSYPGSLTVRFRLRNGRCITRSYGLFSVSGERREQAVKDLFENVQYRPWAYPVLGLSNEEISNIGLDFLGKPCPVDLTDGDRARLLALYQSDLEEMDYESFCSVGPVAILIFQKTGEARPVVSPENSGDGYLDYLLYLEQLRWYPVYASFERTNAFLKERGYSTGNIDADAVEQLELRGYVEDGRLFGQTDVLTVTEPDEIREILEVSVFECYAKATGWNLSYWRTINVKLKFKGEDAWYNLNMNPYAIPEFVTHNPVFEGWS